MYECNGDTRVICDIGDFGLQQPHQQLLQDSPHVYISTRLADDEAVFQQLAVGMDELYAGTDRTFQRIGMHKVDRPGRISCVTCTSPLSWAIEFRDVNILPFGVDATERALWIYQAGGAKHAVRSLLTFQQCLRSD